MVADANVLAGDEDKSDAGLRTWILILRLRRSILHDNRVFHVWSRRWRRRGLFDDHPLPGRRGIHIHRASNRSKG
jgi:hypothetical protein